MRRVLTLAAACAYAGVFAADAIWERPGLGIGHFFYIAIALLALSAGPLVGALGGALAAGLYSIAILIDPKVAPSEVLTLAMCIRAVTFISIGALIGWHAARNRRLVTELEILAQRDVLTGLPNTRAFEAAINRHLEAKTPFALLLGDMDGLIDVNRERGRAHANDLLREIAGNLSRSLEPGDEIARVGGDEFAVLTRTSTSDQASQLAGRLERVAQDQGGAITFGWSSFPQDGENALSLYRAADERLYARKLVRGRRHDPVTQIRAVG
jgi:diguanylate cyclase (GGDEF)-like protein